MIDGSIVEKENFDAVDLVYHSNNGKDIRIEDIASGFKPLVYMLRLIENGWLTENTLLEIDEPETNLHPQWVVELAHLLVRINKTFGTKILITSHNPDMVSAIRYISEKEGLLNTTRFIWQSKVKVQTRSTIRIWAVTSNLYLNHSTSLLILFRNT